MKLGLRAGMILGIEMKYFKYTYDACVRAEYFRLVILLCSTPYLLQKNFHPPPIKTNMQQYLPCPLLNALS